MTRRNHVWRALTEANPDVWLDLMRVDRIVAEKGRGENYKKHTYNLKWADEADPLAHETRRLTLLDVANPQDASQTVPVHVVKRVKSQRDDQTEYYAFLNDPGQVVARTVKIRRVYHRPVISREPPSAIEPATRLAGADYQVDPTSEDQTQYVDVEVTERLVTERGRGPTFQRETYVFKNDELYQFSVPAPEDHDPEKVIRLDPYQSIVNVQWGGETAFVATTQSEPPINVGTIDTRRGGAAWANAFSETDVELFWATFDDERRKYFAGGFRRVGPDQFALILESTDGLSWTDSTHSLAEQDNSAVSFLGYDIYSQTAYAVVDYLGDEGTRRAYMRNVGAGWETYLDEEFGAVIDFANDMHDDADFSRPFGGGIHFRIMWNVLEDGFRTRLDRSTDDRASWSPVTIPGADRYPTGFALGRGLALVSTVEFDSFATGGALFVSQNSGASFARVGPLADVGFFGCGFAGGRFAAVGDNFIVESENGITGWTQVFAGDEGNPYTYLTTGR